MMQKNNSLRTGTHGQVSLVRVMRPPQTVLDERLLGFPVTGRVERTTI